MTDFPSLHLGGRWLVARRLSPAEVQVEFGEKQKRWVSSQEQGCRRSRAGTKFDDYTDDPWSELLNLGSQRFEEEEVRRYSRAVRGTYKFT